MAGLRSLTSVQLSDYPFIDSRFERDRREIIMRRWRLGRNGRMDLRKDLQQHLVLATLAV